MRPEGVTNARAKAARTSSASSRVLLGLVVSSEQPRGLREDPRRPGEVRGGHHVGVGLRATGLVGGAVGSSQSPYWKPPLHSRSGPAEPTIRSTQARMLGSCRCQDLRSPVRWYSVHGTIVAASPQAAAGVNASALRFDVGHDVRDRTVGQLLGAQVRQPGAQQTGRVVQEAWRSVRRPGRRRSSRAARRAAGSRSAGRRSCRGCSRPRSRGTGRGGRSSEENQPVRRRSDPMTTSSTSSARRPGTPLTSA